MNDIPLISKADTQNINTSLIAIKKAQQQLNDLINTADGKIKELNSLIDSLNLGNLGGSGKYIQSIEQIKGKISATVGELTDTISLNNTQPATSNGVAQAINSVLFNDFSTLGNDSDLNNCTNPHVIYTQSQTVVIETFVHRPPFLSAGEMALIYIPLGSNLYPTQIYIGSANRKGFIAQRFLNSQGWSDWVRIDASMELENLSLTYTMETGYTSAEIMFQLLNFTIGQLAVFHLRIINVSGGTLGTTSTNVIAQTNLQPKQETFAIGMDYISASPIRLSIGTDGKLKIQESKNLEQGNNAIMCTFVMPL